MSFIVPSFLIVVICFQISIFAESYTPRRYFYVKRNYVVICFQISIFAESYTPLTFDGELHVVL